MSERVGDESILGLLLRAHSQASAQQNNENFHLKNENAALYYSYCVDHLHRAIQSLFLAERAVGYDEGRKRGSNERA